MHAPENPSRFELGLTVITAAAKRSLNGEDVLTALGRHVGGDWGELNASDKNENERALASEGRLFSRYRDRNRTPFYVITEADRSATTVLLPEDY